MTQINAIEAFRAKMGLAKQAQIANGQNGNLRDHVGEQMVVKGMKITEGIEIDNLTIDKITFFLADGTAIDGFHAVAVDRAEDLIEVLGEGPYPLPLLMVIKEIGTKRGAKQYAELIDFASSPSDVAFAELDESLHEPETTPPATTTPPEPTTPQTPPANTPTDPYAGLTPRQRKQAEKKAAEAK
jgi:hypothetical protein